MGTRSLTVLQNEEGQDIVVMYRQFDGYPEGHGLELAKFLSEYLVVNGIGANMVTKVANGGGDLAAQVIMHFKADSPVGGIYLHPAGTRDAWQDYVYFVRPTVRQEPHIKVYESVYTGQDTPDELVLLMEGTASEVVKLIQPTIQTTEDGQFPCYDEGD